MPSRKDDFWDLSKLIPQTKTVFRKPSGNADRKSGKTELSETVIIPAQNRDESRYSLSRREEERRPEREYTKENTRIKRVRISHFRGSGSFYEAFAKDSVKYWDYIGPEAPFVPFFSYIPQYTQLSRPQSAYYFYWRSEVRQGRYPKTDFSYIMLLLHEIINTPSKIPPKAALEAMCDIWLAYRHEHPRLDKYLCEWVCDYCLIYELDPPKEKLEEIMPQIITSASLREFYIGSSDSISSAAAMINFCSSYNWKKSKFATPEALPLFRRHIAGAAAQVISNFPLSEEHPKDHTAHLCRDAFCGALCTAQNKRKIEVEYYPFSRSHFSGFAACDLVKYAENRIRAYLGVKSRLSVGYLPQPIRDCMDKYFADALPLSEAHTQTRQSEKKEQPPEYEKYYISESAALDISHAAEIERSSWQTTRLLVPENELEEHFAEDNSTVEPASDTDAESNASDVFAEYIKAALACDRAALTTAVSKAGLPEELLVEKINEAALERMGDILFELGEAGYTIIEDYREEAEEWAR